MATTLAALQLSMAARWDGVVRSGLTRGSSLESAACVSGGVAFALPADRTRFAEPRAWVTRACPSEEQRPWQDLATAPALLVGRVPEQFGVQRPVGRWGRQGEVLWLVVRSVLIEVMHDVPSRQRPAEDLAHHEPVLKDGLAVDREHLVAVREAPRSRGPRTAAKRIAGSRPALPVVFAPASGNGRTVAGGDAAGAV